MALYQADLLLKNVSKAGIEERSAFHQIEGFHVTQNLVVDKSTPPPIAKTFTSKNSKIKVSAKEM